MHIDLSWSELKVKDKDENKRHLNRYVAGHSKSKSAYSKSACEGGSLLLFQQCTIKRNTITNLIFLFEIYSFLLLLLILFHTYV